MDKQKYSSIENKQARKDLMIEHVLIELTKTFLLICMSVFLFFNGALLYGFLVGIFAYFYVFYGLFVKAPVEVKPHTYVGGHEWYERAQRRFENDRRLKIEKIKGSRGRPHSPRPYVKSSPAGCYEYANNHGGLGLDNDNDNDDEDWRVNPATGLLMFGLVDTAGNPSGSRLNSDVNDICCSETLDYSYNNDICSSSICDDDWNNGSDDWNS